MTKQAQVLAVLAGIARRAPEELRPEHELVADLGIDSPKALRLLVQLEDQLGIEIDDEQAARMNTVGDVLEFVARRGA